MPETRASSSYGAPRVADELAAEIEAALPAPGWAATSRPSFAPDARRPAVEVAGLAKRYPKMPVDALASVSFAVRPGEVFGLLGPNGAGKTTTIGILTTRVLPTAGGAHVAGVDVVASPVAARRVLGVVPQRSNLDRSLTIRQNLTFHASYHGSAKREREERADRLLAQFGLAERANHKPDLFSGGQAQRMMIARALMHAPLVLFLDEPSTGLDPAARLFVWDRIRELKASGTTIVLTTHDMDEAASLCDRVGIMDHGRLLALDEPATLVSQLPGERTLDVRVDPGPDASAEWCEAALGGISGVMRVEGVSASMPFGFPGMGMGGMPGAPPMGGGGGMPAAALAAMMAAGGPPGGPPGPLRYRLSVVGEAAAYVEPVATVLRTAGCALAGVTLGEPSLEDVFIHLTGRALR